MEGLVPKHLQHLKGIESLQEDVHRASHAAVNMRENFELEHEKVRKHWHHKHF